MILRYLNCPALVPGLFILVALKMVWAGAASVVLIEPFLTSHVAL
jgi:hypothetical protein